MDRIHDFLARARTTDRRIALLTTGASALALGILTWCIRDYRAYLALGPGGPPHNVLGWAVITFLVRPLALGAAATTSVRDYPPAADAHADIRALPVRSGERARVAGVAPHRQLTQHPPEALRERILDAFASAAARNPALVEVRTSLYERHNKALFVAPRLLEKEEEEEEEEGGRAPETARIARGEIGHPHPDLSIHLYFSPADARVLIEKGWAERHRLAVPRGTVGAGMYRVADTFLMVYGPRDEEELEVLRTVLTNSIRFMTGTEDVAEPQREG